MVFPNQKTKHKQLKPLQGLQRELSHVNVLFFSFQGYSEIRESTLLWKNRDFDIWYSPPTFCHNFSFPVYTAPFQWRLLIYIRKNLLHGVLEANKKQVPLKRLTGNKNQFCQSAQNYRPEDSVCIYSCLSNHKNWGPSPYDSLCHADNRRYFSGLPLTQN